MDVDQNGPGNNNANADHGDTQSDPPQAGSEVNTVPHPVGRSSNAIISNLIATPVTNHAFVAQTYPPITSLFTYKEGDVTLTFPSLESLQTYVATHSSNTKLKTYGKTPKSFSGIDDSYTYEDFIDAFESYVDITSPNKLVVLGIHSLVTNPARKFMAAKIKNAGLSLQTLGYMEYKSFLKTFSYKPELTPTQHVVKLFNMKLHNIPIDQFYAQFSEQLMKCPSYVLDTPQLQIAAFYGAMPSNIQKLVTRDSAGNEWASLANLMTACKEAIVKFGNQSSSTSKSARPQNALKPRGGVNKKVNRKPRTFHATFSEDQRATPSTAAAKLLGDDKPKDVNGNLITIAKYLASKQANTCCYCLLPNHTIIQCRKIGTKPLTPVQSIPCYANPTLPCRQEACDRQHNPPGEDQGSQASPLQAQAQARLGSVDSCNQQPCNQIDLSTASKLSCNQLSSANVCKVEVADVSDIDDRCLLTPYFHMLQSKAGLQCTVDAFALPDGSNALCSKYRHKLNSCLSTNYKGDIVYANPAYCLVNDFVKHLLACKAKDQSIGALLLIPHMPQAAYALALANKHMQPVHTFPPKTVLFHRRMVDGSRLSCGPCPWQVHVYAIYPHQPLLQACKLTHTIQKHIRHLSNPDFVSTPHTETPHTQTPQYDTPFPALAAKVTPLYDTNLMFRFPVTVSGIKSNAMSSWVPDSSPNQLIHSVNQHCFLDSGATIQALVSTKLQSSINAKIHPLPADSNIQLSLANGGLSPVKGYCHVKLNISGMRSQITALVTDMTDDSDSDIILGQVWLKKHKVILDYGKGTATAFKSNRKYMLVPPSQVKPQLPEDNSSTEKTDTPVKLVKLKLASAKLAAKAIRQGQQLHLVIVKAVACKDQVTDPDIEAVLNEFQDVWPDDLPELPPDRDTPPVIELVPGAKPVFRRRGRYTQAELEEMRKQIEAGIAAGRIRISHSPWGAPVLFVPKKTGRGLRMCVDYRGLNQVTVKNRYPLPRIDDLMDQLSGAKFFSSLDLLHGYYQLGLKEEEIPKTAFITPFGLYEYTVMPFGLTNAPSVFQAYMNKILQPYLYRFVLVYLDDILIYSRTKEEHISHIRQVLQTLRDNKLYVCREKSHFLLKELDFLGHIVTPTGIKPDPKKVEPILKLERPTDVTEIQSFCGLLNYFRKYIPRLSLTLKPLSDLTKKNSNGIWTDECQKAFEEAKELLAHAATLAIPDFTKPFDIISDASDHHVGGILVQSHKPIAFESRLLNDTEQRWPTHDKELFALVHCCRKWRPYIEGSTVTCYTDHSPLQFVQQQKNLNAKQVRWLQFLQGVKPSIVYRPGRGNPADPLTRLYTSIRLGGLRCLRLVAVKEHGLGQRSCSTCDRTQLPVVALVKQRQSGEVLDVRSEGLAYLTPVQPALFSTFYQLDPFYNRTEQALTKDSVIKGSDNLYWYTHKDKKRLCVPKQLVPHVLTYCHDDPFSGHLGYHKTLRLATSKYWWPNMRNDIAQYCKTCANCQQFKITPTYQHPLTPLPVPDGPFQSVSMDFITHLPMTPRGHDALLVMVDRFSKFVLLIPTTTDVTAERVAQLILDRLVPHYGVPTDFVSDRDTKFCSDFFTHWCRMLGIVQKKSSGYHPQTDGQTERMNRTVQQIMRFMVMPNQTNWDTTLPFIQFAINSSFNASTQASAYQVIIGYNPASPFDRLLDFKPEIRDMPLQAWQQHMLQQTSRAKLALQQASNRMAAQANKKVKTFTLTIGDKAWLSTKHLNIQQTGSSKLMPRFVGPFSVTQVINPVTYKLDLPANMKCHPVFHISELKPVPPDTRLPPEPTTVDIDGTTEFFIESILTHKAVFRKTKHATTGKYLYLVKFMNEGPHANQWLSEADFTADFSYTNPILDAYKQMHNLTDPVSDARNAKSSTAVRPTKKRRQA